MPGGISSTVQFENRLRIRMLKIFVLSAIVGLIKADLAPLDEVFAWNELTYNWPDPEAKDKAIAAKDYIPENNLPLGLDKWNDKLFITVPRWKAGVGSSLNYVSVKSANKTASLTPYPDWKANTLPHGEEKLEDNHIVSTFRVKVDPCDRLWVMDTGLADILGSPKQVSPPAIVIFDLKTDKLIRRYNLKDTDQKESSFFANIVVDVSADKCDQAFAYIPDLGGYGLVVYSLADNDSWRFKHNYFHFDPLKGDFNVGGVNFQWTDGVFGLALGPIHKSGPDAGHRTLYFHALAAIREFSVSTQTLQNKNLTTGDHVAYTAFKLEGVRGEDSQASASDLDEKTNVLFLTQLNRDGVACWNTRKELKPENVALVAEDKERLVFTNDIKIDAERNLWILSDKMPVFIYRTLDPKQTNYRILRVKIDDAIKGTVCTA